MKLWQHYYTSCTKGWGKTKGWQTKRKSKEITIQLMEELEQHCHYMLPPGCDISRIEEHPTSFRYFLLTPTLAAVSLTQSVGKNFDGRPGNYFVHNLLCPKEHFKEIRFNPFHIYRTGQFVKEAPTGELEIEPLYLPAYPQAPGEQRTLALLQEHFSIENIRQFMDALLAGDRRIILALEKEEHRFLFIEGTLLLLPYPFREAFTFSTYSHDPYDSPYRCSAILPGTQSNFRFQDNEYRYRYYVFNMPEQRFSEVEKKFDYSLYMTRLLEEGKFAAIGEIPGFLNSLDMDRGPESLNRGIHFYENKDKTLSHLDSTKAPHYSAEKTTGPEPTPASIKDTAATMKNDFDRLVEKEETQKALNSLSLLGVLYRENADAEFPGDLVSAMINLLIILLHQDDQAKLQKMLQEVYALPKKQVHCFAEKLTSNELPLILESLRANIDKEACRKWTAFYFDRVMEQLNPPNHSKKERNRLNFYLETLFELPAKRNILLSLFIISFGKSLEHKPSLEFFQLVLEAMLQHTGPLPGDQRLLLILNSFIPQLSLLPFSRRTGTAETMLPVIDDCVTGESPVITDQTILEVILHILYHSSKTGLIFLIYLYEHPAIEDRFDLQGMILKCYLDSIIKIPSSRGRLKYRQLACQWEKFQLLEEDLVYYLRKYQSSDYENELIDLVEQINILFPNPEANLRHSRLFSSLHCIVESSSEQKKFFKKIDRYYRDSIEFRDAPDTLFLPHPDPRGLQEFQFLQLPGKSELLSLKAGERYTRCTAAGSQYKIEIIDSIRRLYGLDNSVTGISEKEFFQVLARLYRCKKYFTFAFRYNTARHLLAIFSHLEWDSRKINSVFAAVCSPFSKSEEETLLQQLLPVEVENTIAFLVALTQYFICHRKEPAVITKIIAKIENIGQSAMYDYVQLTETVVESKRKKLDQLPILDDGNFDIHHLVPGYRFFIQTLKTKKLFKKQG